MLRFFMILDILISSTTLRLAYKLKDLWLLTRSKNYITGEVYWEYAVNFIEFSDIDCPNNWKKIFLRKYQLSYSSIEISNCYWVIEGVFFMNSQSNKYFNDIRVTLIFFNLELKMVP